MHIADLPYRDNNQYASNARVLPPTPPLHQHQPKYRVVILYHLPIPHLGDTNLYDDNGDVYLHATPTPTKLKNELCQDDLNPSYNYSRC
jgi:hypothetical protein